MASTIKPRSAFGIHSIDHFVLEVPDLAEATRFFTAFGLELETDDDQLLLRAQASNHVWARIRAGARKRLVYLALTCFADDFEPLCAQITAAGGRIAPPAAGTTGDGFWFEDPDGNLLQLRIGEKVTPNFKEALRHVPGPMRLRGSWLRAEAPRARPQRLSHVLMFTPNVESTVAFYMNALGMGFSDGSKGIVAFLHGRHGSDHHLIAFAENPAKGWHHSAWDVKDVDAVGIGKMQMQHAGYTEGWGVGRHVLGSNYFQYVRDPWGSYWEYSADIDFVAPGFEWPAGHHAPENSLYLWGPDVPAYFFENTER